MVKRKNNFKKIALISIISLIIIISGSLLVYYNTKQSAYEWTGSPHDAGVVKSGDCASIKFFSRATVNGIDTPMFLESITFQYIEKASYPSSGAYILTIAGVDYPMNIDCTVAGANKCVKTDEVTSKAVANRLNSIFTLPCDVATGSCIASFNLCPKYSPHPQSMGVAINLDSEIHKPIPNNTGNPTQPTCDDGVLNGGEKCVDCGGNCRDCVEGQDMEDDACNMIDVNPTCVSDFLCEDWTECIDSKQTRRCMDNAGCQVGYINEEQECEIKETCESDDVCSSNYKCDNNECVYFTCGEKEVLSDDGHSCEKINNYLWLWIGGSLILLLIIAGIVIVLKKKK